MIEFTLSPNLEMPNEGNYRIRRSVRQEWKGPLVHYRLVRSHEAR